MNGDCGLFAWTLHEFEGRWWWVFSTSDGKFNTKSHLLAAGGCVRSRCVLMNTATALQYTNML